MHRERFLKAVTIFFKKDAEIESQYGTASICAITDSNTIILWHTHTHPHTQKNNFKIFRRFWSCEPKITYCRHPVCLNSTNSSHIKWICKEHFATGSYWHNYLICLKKKMEFEVYWLRNIPMGKKDQICKLVTMLKIPFNMMNLSK